jgi:putative DNA primase/helicase
MGNNLTQHLAALDADIERHPPPRPLPPELEPVPAFPMNALPDPIRPWVDDVSQRMACPPDFVAVPMLVGLSSLTARKVAIRPQGRSDWEVRGNMWGLIVGRPGMMKSPAQTAALLPLRAMELMAGEVYRDALKDHDHALKVAKVRQRASEANALTAFKKNPNATVDLPADSDIAAPKRERFMVNNLTYESAGAILADNPGGVLLERDEIASLLRNLAQEEQAEARGFYLQSWSGGQYLFDRIGRGHVRIDDLRMSLIGGIQPGPLSRLIRDAHRNGSDGLLERFVIAWPDDPGAWHEVDRWPDNLAKKNAREAFERLQHLETRNIGAEHSLLDGNGLPFLRFSNDARILFVEWRSGLESQLRSGSGAALLESALSKFRKHVPALALTLHLAAGKTGPVDRQSISQALTLADYFRAHARRAYTSGIRPAVKAGKAILVKLRNGGLDSSFTARKVYRMGWEGLSDRETVEAALDMLVEYGWMLETAVADGGRPSVAYCLRPGVEP